MATVTRGRLGLYASMSGMLLIGLAWRAGDYVSERMSALPVLQAPRVNYGESSIDTKTFPLVWVKRPQAAEVQVEQASSIDELFKGRQDDVMHQAPNYVDQFKQAASITGVAAEGVFMNGRYFPAGSKLSDLAMEGAEGKTIVPVIESIKDGKVVFKIGDERVAFYARK